MEEGDRESRDQGPPDECFPPLAESFREKGFPRTVPSIMIATQPFTFKLIEMKDHQDSGSSVVPASSQVPSGDVWLAVATLDSADREHFQPRGNF